MRFFSESSHFSPMFGVGSKPHPCSFTLFTQTPFYRQNQKTDPFECLCDLISPTSTLSKTCAPQCVSCRPTSMWAGQHTVAVFIMAFAFCLFFIVLLLLLLFLQACLNDLEHEYILLDIGIAQAPCTINPQAFLLHTLYM